MFPFDVHEKEPLMSQDELGQELERLHELLAQPGELSELQREKLQQVAADIEAALGDGESSPEVNRQIDDLILDFEAHHPTLTDLLRRIVDGLANLGI